MLTRTTTTNNKPNTNTTNKQKGDLPTIRLLLRGNAKLVALGDAGAGFDLRALTDRYGKTPRDIALDLKRCGRRWLVALVACVCLVGHARFW